MWWPVHLGHRREGGGMAMLTGREITDSIRADSNGGLLRPALVLLPSTYPDVFRSQRVRTKRKSYPALLQQTLGKRHLPGSLRLARQEVGPPAGVFHFGIGIALDDLHRGEARPDELAGNGLRV